MTLFSDWAKNNLSSRDELQDSIEIGDLCMMVNRPNLSRVMVNVEDKDDEIHELYKFLGYGDCKWRTPGLPYHNKDLIERSVANCCYGCKGKLLLRNVKTGEENLFCCSYSVGIKSYSNIKIVSKQILEEELFEI